MDIGWSSDSRDGRGQSSPIAMVLIFALVIGATTTVVVIGGSAINDTKEQLDMRTAENTMTQLDSQASLVALGASNTQQVELSAAGDRRYRLVEDAGQITVSHHTTSNGTEQILQDDLGKVYYEDGETEVAYQGGGVWRSDGDGNAIMISPPEFHYRGATLTLPIVTVSGEKEIRDRAVITHNNTEQFYPNQSAGNVNPLGTGQVSVSVQSEYYRAWGNYFAERTDGSVNYDHDANTAILNLTISSDGGTITGGMVSGGTGTKISLKNGAEMDSYNSSNGDYASTGGGDDGDIYTAGEVDMKSNSRIKGSLIVGDELTMKNGAKITGDLTHSGSLDLHSSKSTHVDGTVTTGAEVPDLMAVGGRIDQRRTALDAGNNDNGNHSGVITALQTNGTCSPCNVTAGQYYLSDLNLESDGQVYLKPEGRTIEIVVDGDIVTHNGGDIEVIGDGRVNVYVEGSAELKSHTDITNEGDNAPQFWLFMNHDETFDMKANGVYTGVIYGPGPDSASGVVIKTKASNEIYGALVGDVGQVKNANQIHYDTALNAESAVESGTTLPALTYLHVSTNEVNVTAG